MSLRHRNLMYDNFDRYRYEILMDTYDSIMNSQIVLVKKVAIELGSNELHHMLKYHHKMTLNALYFKNEKIFLDYHDWLYRVYFYRDMNLDFFKYML